ncbi:MAG: hypothetical protein H0W48_00600 [Methylibium sp.]|nr:hypothetical protein [Methylibium sp.]
MIARPDPITHATRREQRRTAETARMPVVVHRHQDRSEAGAARSVDMQQQGGAP